LGIGLGIFQNYIYLEEVGESVLPIETGKTEKLDVCFGKRDFIHSSIQMEINVELLILYEKMKQGSLTFVE
jgi:hypothetical protein